MMRTLTVGAVFLTAAAGALVVEPARAADVRINIGIPAPAIVIQAPPRLVLVPGTPVFYAPEVEYNYFVYGDHHYIVRDGRWFIARTHRGPWRLVAVERVPRPIVAVPVTYYRVPPGHAKKFVRDRDDDRDDDRDRGKRHGHGKRKHRDRDD
jgi:hypothetical protein